MTDNQSGVWAGRGGGNEEAGRGPGPTDGRSRQSSRQSFVRPREVQSRQSSVRPGEGQSRQGSVKPTEARCASLMAANAAAMAVANPAAKTKSKKKNFVQQKVKVFRASHPRISVLMWGVNHSINDITQVPVPVMLLPDDFKANSKIKVVNHLFNRENMPSHFKFKEYCPQVFRNLRERFGIDDLDYQASLTRSPPYLECDAQDDRFLLSYDKTLAIKEISSEHVADMHSILAHYHQHIVECHGCTLLPQFLGMYRLGVDGEDHYMLIMRNMFSHRLTVHKKYDLKGSLVSREASGKEKVKELPTLKDMDFLNTGQKVYITDDQKKLFLDKLKRDVEFLVQLKIMDYSLLVGIHDVARAEQEDDTDQRDDEDEENECNPSVGTYGASPEGIAGYLNSQKPLAPGEFDPYIDVYAFGSTEGAPTKEVYFMGLIDMLTLYDTKKKAAHAAKTVKHGAGAEISTVNPEQYAKRFLEFITNIFA